MLNTPIIGAVVLTSGSVACMLAFRLHRWAVAGLGVAMAVVSLGVALF